ncbi:MAG: 30S ribosomal protein S15 [Candidatus Thermoplasmatota archaeon]
MARIYTHRKGKAGSHRIRRSKHPDWSALNPREVESHIIELAKQGKTSSEIGIHLRDQYAVPDVRVATGKRINQILSRNNMLPEIPDDLKSLIRTALRLQKHLEEHKKDLKTKRNLQLVESKIWRLTNYYHRINRLPRDWKYTPEQAKVMFESA